MPIGPVITMSDPVVTEALATCGYDFVWIDMEHSASDKTQVSAHIVAARGSGMATLVRVAANDPVLAKPILDMGPSGIVFPMINTADEAARDAARRLAVLLQCDPVAEGRGYPVGVGENVCRLACGQPHLQQQSATQGQEKNPAECVHTVDSTSARCGPAL